jgi:Ca-activated chloride channel family protein
MKGLMRCLFCGLLQDEPEGVKQCQRCGGELVFEAGPEPETNGNYLQTQMELDQVNAPAGQMVDRHLLITIKTPENVPEKFLADTESGRQALSLHVVLDVSGSMHGMKIENTKQALRMAARILREGDNLAMSVFSDSARLVLPPTSYNEKTRRVFESVIDELRPGGMTALYDGLDLGLQQADTMHSDNHLTLLLSDGQANVGETNLEIVGNLAKEGADRGLVVSTLGVGMDYNEALMTEIATQGKGRFYHVKDAVEIAQTMSAELGEAADIAARDVKLHIHLPEGAALIPLSAAYRCEIIDSEAIVSIGDIPIDLEVEVPLRLTMFTGTEGERLGVDGEITYTTPSGEKLKAQMNRVTVRFIQGKRYQKELGLVKPVAERIARQMHAKQVLNFSRAYNQADEAQIRDAEQERNRLREYVSMLDEPLQKELIEEMDADLHSVRSGSPMAKNSVYNAYQTQRSMRGRKK